MMITLIAFAFLAGIMTVFSPCSLPILPAILSAGVSKGKKRPLGVILGLIVSFSFFTLAIGLFVKATGISPTALRYAAIGLLALFGLILIFPKLGEVFAKKTAPLADLGSRLQQKIPRDEKSREGFWGGVLLGAALGLVWVPCAGPILASVIILASTSQITSELIAIMLAYSIGSAIPLLLIMWASQRAMTSSKWLSRHSEGLRRAFGVVMIATAAALYYNVEIYFQQLTLNYAPWVFNIENNKAVEKGLQELLVKTGKEVEPKTSMPDFVDIAHWINSPPNSRPLTAENLKGKVVLVDFWTYSCINCIRTLPHLKKWWEKYHDKGLIIIGIHTPEFAFEKDLKNVEQAVKRFKITYPVALDNSYGTWQAYHNRYWPAHYLYDTQGVLKETHFGEGGYLETENAIRSLLGLTPLTEKEKPTLHPPTTRETYLGNLRADSYAQKIVPHKMTSYIPAEISTGEISLSGLWEVGDESILSGSDSSTLQLKFVARQVYLVLSSEKPALLQVLLDGKPIAAENYTADIDPAGKLAVKEARKYDVLTVPGELKPHLLTLVVPKGVKAYAFTFGAE